MRPQKVLDSDMIKGLTHVFRSKGYDGANLSELAEATNLKKASLYHRFPGGKQEMAKTVLTHIEKWVEVHVLNELKNEEVAPKKRLVQALYQIDSSYNGGKETCIFRALSLESGITLFQQQIEKGMQQWIDAFESFGMSIGLSKDKAHELSVQTLIDIQGSLVVAKGMNSPNVFKNALKKIETRYSL
ncbi:TetR/AcrR family transcriptional regulator [Aureisphaera galaxeae]|uniref:TetR/AcrR family transcriptional regulator n=1 Tax=Aureisphaera galaxeae TaxID=1538023 RepID=UPI002350C74F|nr:TetR/AcrR family transcriptional regulator [Aureisphaera galaxeae]MDC8004832.1 TetR/AcrR family transcriptional regulator [Aureisphaera galaxeae]